MKNDKWLDLTNGVCWSIIFSLAAIIMSIAALADTHPRVLYSADGKTVVLGFDYIGVIVGVLALLVTCLVAWNIWQVFDTKNTVSKAEEVSERIQEFEKKLERCKNLHKPFIAYTVGLRHFDTQRYSSAIHYFFSMIEMYVDYDIEYNNYLKDAADNIISCIKKEPWNYKNRIFIDRVDGIIRDLRKHSNSITNIELRLRSVRKELEPLCGEDVPNPYPIQHPQNLTTE